MKYQTKNSNLILQNCPSSKKNGFTLIELLVVIAIIGVLASIVLSSLETTRERARDSIRKQNLQQIGTALQVWALDYGDMKFTLDNQGCGFGGASLDGVLIGGSYIERGSGAGAWNTRSVMECLVDEGYLESPIYDPSGYEGGDGPNQTPTNDVHRYMKTSCPEGTYLYAKLESEPQSASAMDNTCLPTADTAYGYNYWFKVE